MRVGTDTRAVVTGGSSGIGKAISRQLLRRGASVTLVARNPQRLEAARNELASLAGAGKERVGAQSVDVSSPADCDRLASELSQGAAVNLLVNCHGETYPEYFERIPTERFERLIRINLIGVWNMCGAFLATLESARGTIVNVASVGGLVGAFGYSAYSATKFGVVGLSEVLRNELKPRGIDVKVLCPPDTDTPMLKAENEIKPFETKEASKSIPVMSADAVALSMIKGLGRRRFLVIPGFMSKVTFRLKGVWPGLVFRIMDGDVAKARAAKAAKEAYE